MRVDTPEVQLRQATHRAGLVVLFGEITFCAEDTQALSDAGEGEFLSVRFGNSSGPIGTLHVDLFDSGNPEDAGLTVGLRGWQLDEGVASV